MAALWVILIIILIIVILYYVVLGIIYGVAYLGMTIIISIDYVASAFTWIGVTNPAVGWLFLGCLTGATIGLIKGLKKAGRKSDLWKVYGGAVLLVVLLMLSAYAAYPPGNTVLQASDNNLSNTSPTNTTTTSTPTRNLNHNTTNARRLKSNSRVTVGTGEKFEVRITKGFISSNSIVLVVRETSMDFTGYWLPWRDVVAGSYLTDSANNTYYPDVSKSTGWNDGNVRPGIYREGQIVFNGTAPPNALGMTLYFAYYPGSAGGFARLELSLN